MRRIWIVVIAGALLVAMAMPALSTQRTRAVGPINATTLKVVADAQAQLSKIYTAAQLQAGVYVGSNFCMGCHTDMTTYRDTAHANFLRRPVAQYSLVPGKGVIANALKGTQDDFVLGLDFNKLSGTPFDKYKPNAPKLSVQNGTYYITIGTLQMPVIFTVAGDKSGNAQRYVVKVPVADTPNKLSVADYYAPLQYDPNAGWSASSPTGWYDATTNAPKFSAGIGSAAIVASNGPSSHTSGCIGCHSTGVQSIGKTAAGEAQVTLYTAILYSANDPSYIDYNANGQMELLNIGCEDCHGPGSNHLLSYGDPSKIVNPANLTKAQQAEICGRCHITGKSVPAGSYNWPYNDATNTSWTPFDAAAGTPLSTFYTNAAKYWPDGTINGGRPYDQWVQSNHATFAAHTVSCPDCHDAHNEGAGMLIRSTVAQSTVVIPTAVDDNTLCLGCHATHGSFAGLTQQDVYDMTQGKTDATAKIASVVATHTNHPYAPARLMGLSRCTDCHMAAAGHSFKMLSPDLTLQYQQQGGMPNSCAAGCHNNRVDVFGIGMKGSATGWGTPFDTTLANALKHYYGNGGIWWNTQQQ